jgi:Ca2+-binding RTX toxin-like protein
VAPTDTTGLQPGTAPFLLPITIVPAQAPTTPTSTGQAAAPGTQTGQAANLLLIGAPDTTSLAGGAGNDLLIAPATTAPGTTATLQGNAGNDALIGRGGNDVLQGGPGDDMLFGGIGTNQLNGGPGRDLFVFEGGTDTIQDFTPADGDRIRITGDAATVSALVASAVATPDGVRLTPEAGASITLLGISPQELSTDWFTPTP